MLAAIAMRSYRITKFNPKLRNDKDVWLDKSEWTSISDVLNNHNNGLTFEDYIAKENAYVDAIKVLMLQFGQEGMEVSELEIYKSEANYYEYQKKGYLQNISLSFDALKKIKIGDTLTGITLDNACRLTLREFLWMNLTSKKLNIMFGYDYYMYAQCEAIDSRVINVIEAKGLYVE